MPTLSQMKKAQEIKDPLIKKRYLKYFQLPQDLQQIMFTEETANKIHQAGKKNNLNENQLWWASHTAGMIILGETNIINFVKTLQEKCKLTEEPARQLARDINQAIFLPVKEDLKKIHKVPQWPREEETRKEETKEPLASPKIEGNVVNLKE